MLSGRSTVLGSSLWMVVISILLSWMPVVGPLIGGVVGGHKAGTIGKALYAAILPAVFLAGIIWFGGMFTGIPLLGTVAAIGTGSFAIMMLFPMIGGALLGGALK